MSQTKTVLQLNLQLEEGRNRPKYRQIVEYVIDRIRCGDWPAGAYLPDQRQLAKSLNVNRSTVVSAIDELKSMGYVETLRRGGTVVIGCSMPVPEVGTPDWSSHISEGFHFSNLDTIQIINRYEFSEGFIRLSSGEPSPELFPREEMKEVLSEVADEMMGLGYEEPLGMPYLREHVVDYVKGLGIDTRPANVLIVSGALQAIQLVSMGLLQPGSTVFLEKPSYLYSLSIFQSIGMRRFGVAMDSFGMQAEAIRKSRLKNRQSMIYTVPSFHNPTGVCMSEMRRQELLKTSEKAQIPIVEDDVYRELWIDEPSPLPIKHYDQFGSVLYVGSVSKALSTGLRIGWLIGPETVVQRLGELKMQNDYGSSSLAQLTAGKFLEKGLYEAQCIKVRGAMKHRRNIMDQALNQYLGHIAAWQMPSGGYYFWVTFLYPIRMQGLFEAAFKSGVLMYPGYLYDSAMNQSIRLSFSYASEYEIVEGIRLLGELAPQFMDFTD